MAYTESEMMELGTKAPAFTLMNTVDYNQLSLEDIASDKGTVIMFICNHCPYVKHVNSELVKLAEEYQNKGISFIAINSNDVENYPEDSPEKMKKVAESEGYPFPYLYDETQEVARAYEAACTPDFYAFDGNLELFYRGRLDGSRPKNDVPLTGEDLRNALDSMLTYEDAPEKQYPSAGCGIKWK